MPTVEFHFDFGSPNAFLAHLALPQVEERTGIKVEYVPVLLGGVFKATNNMSPAESLVGIKNKPEYAAIETKRFCGYYNVSMYRPNPHFPVNTLQIMRGAVYAQKAGFFQKYVNVVYEAMWMNGKKMDEPETIAAVLSEGGFPANEIIQGMADPDVKRDLIDNTNRSVEMGSFGSPTFYVGTEIFFGKDKLREVEEEIVRQS